MSVKLIDKLWNWGHLEGSHNKIVPFDCKMSPEGFADEYGIKNSFIVSYGGNIQPPFNDLAKRFSKLNNVKWSVLGDASSPLPDAELGNTDDVIECLSDAGNISGCVMDDFFSPERMERFPPKVLKKIQNKLNQNGLDFWCVLYNGKLDEDVSAHLECFDGVSFWIWGCDKIVNVDTYVDKFLSITKGKKRMLGIYLYDYLDDKTQPMNIDLFKMQMDKYFNLLKDGVIDGIIFCSNTVGDADLETNKLLKQYVKKYGDIEIKE